MTATLPPPRSAAQRLAVLALLAAFVLAQALGWIHRGLHGDGPSPSPSPAAVAPHEVPGAAKPGWFDALFGSHADASDCRLFDVIASPALASAHLVVLPAVLPPGPLAAGHAGFVARRIALFDARGPPPSR